MSTACDDYDFWTSPDIMAAVYIALCAISLFLNFDVLALVYRSKRMLWSPKYWLVFVVSIAFMFQSAVPNIILVAKWLSEESAHDIIWKMCVVFNRYIGMGVATWGSVLINLDFLLCMKSAAYTRYYRGKVILFLTILVLVSMISTVVAISILYNPESSGTTWLLDETHHQILLWTTLFAPLALSFLCCTSVMIWRCSNQLQEIISTNEDVSDPVDSGDFPYLPPSDHITFILILVIFYVPVAIVTYEPIWLDECRLVLNFLTASTVLRDNVGCIAPVAWFLFKDIRLSCKKCFTRRSRMLTESFLESSEMNIYDSYPYCNRILF